MSNIFFAINFFYIIANFCQKSFFIQNKNLNNKKSLKFYFIFHYYIAIEFIVTFYCKLKSHDV